MVKFEKIVVYLPDIDPECLSTDQKYLLEMCQVVCSGIVPDNLANRDPGALCHARWLTAANRILRSYVSEHNPSKNLRILAEYITRVYAKVWFMIKKNWQFYHSSFHVWETIRESRFLPKKLREAAVDPCIQTNAFALHP